jgi:hypothetical protein
MPRCPNCPYELEAWLGANPCPECGQVPREYAHRFFTPLQRAVVIVIVVVFPAAHLVLRSMSINSLRNNVLADLTLLLCIGVIFIGPALLAYLVKDRFDRGLSKGTAVTFAAMSLIPACLLNVLIQSLLG